MIVTKQKQIPEKRTNNDTLIFKPNCQIIEKKENTIQRSSCFLPLHYRYVDWYKSINIYCNTST